MRKLELPPEPPLLTAHKDALTEKFKANPKSAVWREDEVGAAIRATLWDMSGGKCAYSEAPLDKDGTRGEIEHHAPKNKHPQLVVAWGNLLPVCKFCNTAKGALDVVKYPIVNPLKDDPKQFLFVSAFRYYPRPEKKEVAERTIRQLRLNDREQFTKPRSAAAFKLVDELEAALERFEATDDECRRLRLKGDVLSVMVSCGARCPYSAVVCTHVLYEYRNWNKIERLLRDRDEWDETLQAAKQAMVDAAMPE